MFLGNLNYVAIAVLGGLRVASGQLSLGDVQAFIQYSRQFTQPLTQVASMVNLLQSGVASAERVFELLDAAEEPVEHDARPPADVAAAGEVVFDDVSFRYDPDRPLLEDLSLVARPGQTVAIVGPTGAGKTTLVNLVMRFYDVDAGRITLDGVDIATPAPRRPARAGRHGAAGHLAVRRDDPRQHRLRPARRDRARRCSRPPARPSSTASCTRLPDGYDTVVDEEGSGVSAGERQLITHRPGVPVRPRAAHPRRGDQLGRHPHRAAAAAGDGGAAQRPDQLRHRPPALDRSATPTSSSSWRTAASSSRATTRSCSRAGGAYAELYDAQFAAPAG